MSGDPRWLRRTFSQTFLSLRTRNFRLFFIGQMISNTGNWMTRVALILLVLNLTGSGLAVGFITACEFGPVLLLSAWAGAIADRSDKRRLLLVTQALEMVQSIALAVVAFMPDPSLPLLYGLTVIGGALLAFDNPLRRSFVTEMVPTEDIPNAVVLYSTIVNVSRVFGPALAGLLVTTLGYGWAFSIDAVSYLTVILCLWMMRTSELDRAPGRPRERGEIREGIRYVLSQPRLSMSFAMLIAVGLLAYNFSITLPLFVTDSLHSTDTAFTILYSVFSVGAVLSALIVANRAFVKLKHILIGAAMMGAAMVVLALMPGVALAGIAVFFVGMATILYMTATTAIIQIEARRDMHGRVLALQTVIMGGTKLVGGPLLGWMADKLGGRAPIILGGLVCIVAAGAGWWGRRRYPAVG